MEESPARVTPLFCYKNKFTKFFFMNSILKSRHRHIVSLCLGAVIYGVIAFSPMLSHAQTNGATGSSLLQQMFATLESLQQQVAALAATRPENSGATKVGCVDNKINYTHNQSIPALTLSNGLKSFSKGNEYRCDSGRWIFQAVPKVGATSQGSTINNQNFGTGTTSQGSCVANSKTYNAGTEIRGLSLFNPKDIIVSNRDNDQLASTYVCRGGSWVPVTPGPAGCKLPNQTTVPHGTVSSSSNAVTTNGFSKDPLNVMSRLPLPKGPYTCINGVWRPNASSCKVGSQTFIHGSTSNSPEVFNQYINSLPAKMQNSLFTEILLKLKLPLVCQNGKFGFPVQEKK